MQYRLECRCLIETLLAAVVVGPLGQQRLRRTDYALPLMALWLSRSRPR